MRRPSFRPNEFLVLRVHRLQAHCSLKEEQLRAYRRMECSQEQVDKLVKDLEETTARMLKAAGLAQILKDAVMAASLEPFLDHRVLFCCGHFHSDYHLGIPYQLQKIHPEIKIAVIAFASSVIELNGKDASRLADFIWIGEG